MKVLQSVKDDFHSLREGRPGKRFRQHVDERRQRRGGPYSASRILTFAVGSTLIVVGLGIGWLPGPGGFLALVGLALVAQEIPVIADALDWCELKLRRLIRMAQRRWH